MGETNLERIDHDRLFKEFLQVFFLEFIGLFLPEILAYLDPDSLVFLDKEIFTDITSGDRHEVDLVVKAKFLGEEAFFLIHIENESGKKDRKQRPFNRRMFRYFSRLLDTHDLPIYPIVIFSYDAPYVPEVNTYEVGFPGFRVLSFQYQVIQLNQLNWRDFLNQPNPVASALMAKMAIAPQDRPRVKLECLRMLATLKLNPAKSKLISGFVDTYLKLTAAENQVFRQQLAEIEPEKQEGVMQIVTSWMEEGLQQGLQQGLGQGLEQGLEQGKQLGELSLVLRLIRKSIGVIAETNRTAIEKLSLPQLEELGEALFELKTETELIAWLAQHN